VEAGTTVAPRPAAGGLTERRVAGATIVCREAVARELERIYAAGGSVYAEVQDQDSSLVLYGRQPLVAGMLAGVPVLVKRLYHGGFLAGLTGDRFLTSRRFRTHLECGEFLAANGVPTPETLFVAWRRRGLLVRGEIGVRYIARAFDAAGHLFPHPHALPADWRQRIAAVAAVTARLHRLGVEHGDLNLRNFLFVPSGDLHILDLDKAHRHRPPVPDVARRRNLARLERSLRKLGRGAPARDVEAVADALHAAYRTAYA
jgi:tRNA A-37 threonylcarbamoyl transferase component Bud32